MSGGDNKITYLGPDEKKNANNRIEWGCCAAIRQEGGATRGLAGSSTSLISISRKCLP